MNGFIRAGLVVALGLGLNLLCADAWADDEAAPEPGDRDESAALVQGDATLAEPKAGAGSPEPAEAIDEDPGAGRHQAWVESIWSLP